MYYNNIEGRANRELVQRTINSCRDMEAQLEQIYQKAAQLPDQEEADMIEMLGHLANAVENERNEIANCQANYTQSLYLEFMLCTKQEHYAATKFLQELEVQACKTAYECALSYVMLSRIINNTL